MDVIFDIDGTLLDISDRLKFIESKPRDWKKFKDPALKAGDKPIKPVIDILLALHAAGHRIIIASARTVSEKDGTLDSLRRYIPFIEDVPLYLRSDGDYRKDTVVKSAMLDRMLDAGYKPVVVFDDRPSVIEMWHDRGLKVVDVRDPSRGNF